ncbi:hypothetical protein ACHAQA_003721 [Verticillium albo-atrum]
MAPIRVGVVGYGGSAKSFHIPFITAIPDYEIVAILQRAEAPADPASAPAGSHCTVDFPKVKHHRTADDFFADESIDFVVVATRTDTHIPFAEKALEAGKHVLVDKPFGRSAAEVDRAIELAEKKGRILTCFQNRRWDGGFQTLRELIKKGALGDVKEAEIVYDFENAPWLSSMTATKYTPGDGMAFGLGTHSVDQAVTLFGRPKSVTAFFRAQRGIESEVEDSFTIILQYDGPQKDLLVTVKTAVTSPVAEQLKFYVRGTKGSYIKEEQIAEGVKPLDKSFGVESDALRGVLTTYDEFDSSVQTFDPKTKKYTGRYPTITGRWVGVYENVANAINGKAELEVKAQQSRDAIRVIELARESHEQGVTVAWK